MTYTGDVQSFQKLIDEGERHEDGTVTISVPKVEEIIDNETDGVVECQLTWHVFSKEKWFEVFDVLKERNDITRLHLEHGKMDRDVMKKLAENPHITDLLIETMDTNEEVAELAAMPSLTSLSLIRFCTEGPLKAAALEAFCNSKLTSLTISDIF